MYRCERWINPPFTLIFAYFMRFLGLGVNGVNTVNAILYIFIKKYLFFFYFIKIEILYFFKCSKISFSPFTLFQKVPILLTFYKKKQIFTVHTTPFHRSHYPLSPFTLPPFTVHTLPYFSISPFTL